MSRVQFILVVLYFFAFLFVKAQEEKEGDEDDEDYVPRFFGGRRNGENAGTLPVNRPSAATARKLLNVQTRWIIQKLNHSNPEDTREWPQRYMVNDQYYRSSQKSGPIFVVIGGEWTMSEDQVATGQVSKLARNHNALVLGLEHRFYGESRPTKDASTSNLKYLNSQQALDDLEHFIGLMKVEYARGTKVPEVVLFGCSYAGSLAAFHRSNFPNSTAGAVANSAPIEARENFDAYVQSFFSPMNIRMRGCGTIYQSAFRELDHLIVEKDQKRLKKLFKLCKPGRLDFSNPDAVQSFYYDLTSVLMQAVQFDRAHKDKESDLTRFCQAMVNSSLGTPLERYASWLKREDTTCILNQGKPFAVKSTSWGNKYVARGSRQWLYQMCSEFGFFTSNERPWGPKIKLDFLERSCAESFGIRDIGRSVDATNRRYGGKNWNGTSVFFVLGVSDPWIDVAPSRPRPSVRIRLASGMSHCAEPSGTSIDPPDMVEAWEEIDDHIGRWIARD